MTNKNLLHTLPTRDAARECALESQPARGSASRPRLVRGFIATGEPRFPLASVWSLVRHASATTDAPATTEPESPWLTVGRDLHRWALHPLLTLAC